MGHRRRYALELQRRKHAQTMHAKERLLERYGEENDSNGFREIICLIKGDQERKNDNTAWRNAGLEKWGEAGKERDLFRINEKFFIYDRYFGKIVTFLSPEMICFSCQCPKQIHCKCEEDNEEFN